MTNELEKKFFDTFGIEVKQKCAKPLLKTTSGFCNAYKNCIGCDYNDLKYPQINDHILLELICILTRWHLDECEPYEITSINTEQLKNQILSNSLDIAKCVKTKQQVQAIFK